MNRLLKNFTDIFKPRASTEEETTRVRFLIVFGSIGFVVFIAYTLINLSIADYPIAALELLLAAIILFSMLTGLSTKRMQPAATIGVLPLFVICLHNFISGGFYETGLLWCYVLPPITVFLVGRHLGFYLHAFFVLTTFVFFLLARTTASFTFLYSEFEYFMFVLTLSFVFVMIWLFQSAADASRSVIGKHLAEIDAKKRTAALAA
ncbi:MAG: hypothetical protein TR69_WS6001001377 [candidate division WS6 bacterium OLB20]|uniref:MASE6 domain-containing protein n=1 Tax=candidate division WS6 bacterium OLB20 TaxID=1617426 RepID=A0A136LWR0_9BACT|nr:MAG: hypothetical protein TR69_WS6001001377 [candidate division WS6 bacterium OLB20]